MADDDGDGEAAKKDDKGKGKMILKKKQKISRSVRANLEFPVARVERYLKQGRYASRISRDAPVYMTAALEYLAAEILELGGDAAKANKKSRINSRHLMLAVKNDLELDKLMANVTFAEAGVVPYIHSALLKTKKDSASTSKDDEENRGN